MLEWLIDNKDKGPASIIEEVDGQMIQSLVEGFEYLVVYFCEYLRGRRGTRKGRRRRRGEGRRKEGV